MRNPALPRGGNRGPDRRTPVPETGAVIARRVLAQLRRHDWFAVVIELVVVVVGVFIGLQASNWNEDRQTNARAAVFTERLRADLREEVWTYLRLSIAEVATNQVNLTIYYPEVRGGLRAIARQKT